MSEKKKKKASSDKGAKKKISLKKLNPLTPLLKPLQNEKFQRISGLMLLLLSFYLLVAFTSYLFTWKQDQNLLYGSWTELLFNPELEIANWLGKFGAITSHLFINNWFGISSFLLVGITFLLGLKVLLNVSLLPLNRTIKNTLFVMVWFSAMLGFFFDSQNLFVGGTLGYYMNDWMASVLGSVGTVLFLFFVLISYLIVAFNFSLEGISSITRKILLFVLPGGKEKENEVSEQEEVEPATQFSNINTNKLGEDIEQNRMDLFYPDENKTQEAEPESAPEPEKVEEEPAIVINEIPDIPEMPEVPSVEETPAPPAEPKVEETPVEAGSEINLDSTTPVVEKPAKEESAEEEGLSMDVAVAEPKEEILSEKEVNKKLKDFGEYDPTLDLSKFKLPGLDLLVNHGDGEIEVNREELEANKNNIVSTLNNYKIEIEKIKATIGPTVTLYEIVPAPGVRISKIKNLEDDIALSLAALGIRIIAPIPGKGTIGIEVPNSKPGVVSMKAALASEKFQNTDMDLPLALGKTISNETFVTDLTKMPHLLMAGATGQGKSVGLNAILVSILYKKHPSQVKFVLVDPKKVELTLFNKIERHYLAKLPDEAEPIITDTTKVINTLNSLCIEMDTRYDLLKNAHCRNIKEYNKKFIQRKLNPENGHHYLPYIVLVVDEFADLIMTAGKEVETPIARLAQLARAIGIHLIIATQRPSVNIITGLIKANFPSRIAFRVTAKIDSRTILDAGGADQLIGRGDMLFSNGNDLTRVQCAFVDTPEVEDITDFIGSQQGYPDAFLLPEYEGESEDQSGSIEEMDRDALFEDAARVVVTHQQGSASLLQRRLKLGYNRAGRIIDQLEAAGIIGPFKGSKAREVLIPDEMALEQLLKSGDDDV
ncbi:DNA translocase FtsK [bacterium SCSIO 12741]|nr:DNA translocase FtsK [bacterium SCSIO 12741]